MAKQRLTDPLTAFDAARVVAWRLPLLGLSMMQPNPSRNREMVRMVAEKQQAFVLGLMGAQQALVTAWLNGALDFARVATEVTAAAEAPALRALRVNVRRSSRGRSW